MWYLNRRVMLAVVSNIVYLSGLARESISAYTTYVMSMHAATHSARLSAYASKRLDSDGGLM